MRTFHKTIFKNSSKMENLEDQSVDLVITSPPYPLIEIWDSIFSSFEPRISKALEEKSGKIAFDLMHRELEKVWREVSRVLIPGGICCINIGDATRKLGKTFQIYPNHARIIDFFINNDFIQLPSIIWRKPTNSPTKFLGSGMLAPNAYVTLEHEYILIFRKGKDKRKFQPNSKNRYQSAYFWEERNCWFSDVWTDIMGTSQKIIPSENQFEKIRDRTAAYPFEIPFRLINMFSIYGDTILDPFWGTGTTTLAAISSARNSVGYEINREFMSIFNERLNDLSKQTNLLIRKRIQDHQIFLKEYEASNKKAKYNSIHYNFNVVTKQERKILFYSIRSINNEDQTLIVNHKKYTHNV